MGTVNVGNEYDNVPVNASGHGCHEKKHDALAFCIVGILLFGFFIFLEVDEVLVEGFTVGRTTLIIIESIVIIFLLVALKHL